MCFITFIVAQLKFFPTNSDLLCLEVYRHILELVVIGSCRSNVDQFSIFLLSETVLNFCRNIKMLYDPHLMSFSVSVFVVFHVSIRDQ